MAERKRIKMIYNAVHRKLRLSNINPTKTGCELRCPERVNSSCSISDPRRVTQVANPMISHASEKDRIVITTNRTYPWSFLIQIFRNG